MCGSFWTTASDKAPLTYPHAVCRGSAPPTESEPDEGFEWLTPDESTRLPFVRSPEAALLLAKEWDLCISGDGLLHLQHIGAEPIYIPLAQVGIGWGQSLLRLCHSGVRLQCELLVNQSGGQWGRHAAQAQDVCSGEVPGWWGRSSWLCS